MRENQNRYKYTAFIRPIEWFRFLKFGTVGLSGTIINLMVLYVGKEWIFKDVHPESVCLNLSLGAAILLATINNFAWNRVWTWSDRKNTLRKHLLVQMGQYFLACWLAICLQFLITTLLARFIHYLIANAISIGLSAMINFILNDKWTFCIKRHPVVTPISSPYAHGKKQSESTIA